MARLLKISADNGFLKNRLLRTVFIISLVLATVLPLSYVLLIHPSFTRFLIQAKKEDAINIARHLGSFVVKGGAELTKDHLPVELLNEVVRHNNDFGLTKLKVFTKSGEVIFSTDPRDIGNINRERYFREVLAKKGTYTSVVWKNQESLEGQTVPADVVETYVPLMKNSKFLGAFEIYYDITVKKEQLGKLLTHALVVLFSLAASLFFIIVATLIRENKTIIARQRAEAQVRFQAELMGNVRESVVATDLEGHIIYWGKGAQDLYGYRPEEVMRKPVTFIIEPHEEEEEKDRMRQVFEIDRWSGEYLRRRKDQSRFWADTVISLVRDQKGQPTGFISIDRDITERKRAEDELKWELGTNVALSEIYTPLISPSSSIEDITKVILEQAKRLTGSEHGFVSSIDPVTRDHVGHTLTEMMGDQCKVLVEDARVIFPLGNEGFYRGLWGHSLNTLEPFFTSSPETHPAATGIPEGHIPLNKFLSVPVMLGEELVGQIALANKDEDYTVRDGEAVRRLAEFYALAIQRKRGEEALQLARDDLERKVEERTAELSKSNAFLKQEIAERKRAEEALRESEKQLRLLSSLLLMTQETERKRISRELHDELGGSLAVLKLRTSFIEKNLQKDQTELRQECKQNLEYIDQIIDNVDRLSRNLSPSILEDVGFTPALRRLIDNFTKNYHVRISSDIVNVDPLLPRDEQIMVYRIFQEALTNIGKHAQAKNVSMGVSREDDRISFFLEDDGKGFDVTQAAMKETSERGLGLATMDERARMMGGSLDLRSEKGKGTRITFSIPIRKGENL